MLTAPQRLALLAVAQSLSLFYLHGLVTLNLQNFVLLLVQHDVSYCPLEPYYTSTM